MSKVDFYILSEKHTLDMFICQLCHKVWQQGHQVYVHTDHAAQGKQLDERMWTYSDISFIPHATYDSEQAEQAPITIGWQPQYQGTADVLVNVNQSIPKFSQDFARIVEVVSLDPVCRETGRKHFRQYRDMGCEMESHNL